MNATTNFIIVGAQRSGSTFLYEMLARAPQICMASPVRPEPKYFLGKPETLSVADYHQRFFADRTAQQHILGEKSTSYYESEAAATAIRRILPDARIVFILRDPVERAISNYYFSVNHGLETRSLAQVFLEQTPPPELDLKKFSVNPFDYLHRGEYHKFIALYRQHFPSEQLLVCTLERLIHSTDELDRLSGFIGLSEPLTDSTDHRPVNASERPRGIDADVREKLKHHYRAHNKALADMTGLDLQHWQQ